MESLTKIIALAVLFGAVSGAAAALIIYNYESSDRNALIKDFYLTENAVHISPHSVRKAMDTGDDRFVLVDLRSREEYEREHITGAVSIPAYSDPDTSDYDDVGRIVGSFRELKEDNQDKDIIVYCYSMPCMTGRKIGKLLAENGIYVKHLEIGWNEWRYFWNLWNHEHEWNITSAGDYISSGKEPGTREIKTSSNACPIGNDFGC